MDFNFTKYANKDYVDIGDEITYFLNFSNNTKKIVRSLMIVDTIPKHTTLVADSLMVNGEKRATSFSSIAVDIKDIKENNTVSYKVIVNKQVNIVPVNNVAYAKYKLSNADSMEGVLISNQVKTIINNANLTVESRVDKFRSYVGDILTYTFTLRNLGNTIAESIIIKNYLPEEITLVSNSITIDNKLISGENGQLNNLFIPIIPPVKEKQETVITFKVVIDSLPVSKIISNYVIVSYEYIVDSINFQDVRSKKVESKAITTQVYPEKMVEFNKVVDKATATTSNKLKYFLVVKNTLSQAINNIVFKYNIPQNTTLIMGTLFNDGEPQIHTSESQIIKTTLQSGLTSTVTFKVNINDDIGNVESIINDGYIEYEYINSDGNLEKVEVYSGEVKTLLDTKPEVIYKQFADKEIAYQNDELQYTFVLSNKSEKTLMDIKFINTIPDYTQLIIDSVTFNGEDYDIEEIGEEDPLVISAIDLPGGEAITITYKVRIDYYPGVDIKEVSNKGYVGFKYSDVSNNLITDSISNFYEDFNIPLSNSLNTDGYLSDEVVIPVNNIPLATLNKSVDKEAADNGDVLLYTVVFTNTTSRKISKAKFYDTIPANTNIVYDSLIVDGESRKFSERVIRVDWNDIGVNETRTLSYKVTVDVYNSNVKKIINEGYIGYSIESSPDVIVNITSNKVETNAYYVNIKLAVKVDKANAIVGDVLTYEFNIINLGTRSLAQRYAGGLGVYRDADSAIYIRNSIKVNGQNYDDRKGFAFLIIGDIRPKELITITYKLRIIRMPSSHISYCGISLLFYEYYTNIDGDYNNMKKYNPDFNKLSNYAITNIAGDEYANITKTVNKAFSSMGEELIYTLVLRNTSRMEIFNINIVDTIPDNTTFINDSMILNGEKISDTNPPKVFLESLEVAQSITLNYSVRINNNLERKIDRISNIAYGNYLYMERYTYIEKLKEVYSTEAITLLGNQPSFNLIKTVNKTKARIGEELFYRIVFQNTQSTPVYNVVIKDIVPDNITFNKDSISVGGPPDRKLEIFRDDTVVGRGFKASVEEIDSGKYLSAIYKGTIMYSFERIDDIKNSALIEFEYINEIGQRAKITTKTKEVVTEIIPFPEARFFKTVDKKYIGVNDLLTYDIYFINTTNNLLELVSVINTIPDGTSLMKETLLVDGESYETKEDNVIKIDFYEVPIDKEIHISYKVNVNKFAAIENISTLKYKFFYFQKDFIEINDRLPVILVRHADLKVTLNGELDVLLYDTITYSIEIINSGNINAINIEVTDELSKELNLDVNSITLFVGTGEITSVVRGQTLILSDFEVAPNERKVIEFDALVNDIPSSNKILNLVKVKYKYIVNSDEPDKISLGEEDSNLQETNILINPQPILIKTVNKLYADNDDELIYTIAFMNTTNKELKSLIIVDTIPEDVNIVPQSDKDISFNDKVIRREYSNVLDRAEFSFSYKVKVAIHEVIEEKRIRNIAHGSYVFENFEEKIFTIESMEAITEIKSAIINIEKTVMPLDDGKLLEYTLDITNKGNVSATNVYIRDETVGDVMFVRGLLKIDGKNVDVITLNTIPIGTIESGKFKTVKYVMIGNNQIVPSMVKNKAYIYYNYTIESMFPDAAKGETISKEIISIINKNSGIVCSKLVDKEYADLDDELTYTLLIENPTKNVINNVNITDTIPEDLIIVSDSLMLDTKKEYPTGNLIDINFLSINQQAIVTISYRATINKESLINYDIKNTASIKYTLPDSDKIIQYYSEEAITYIRYASIEINKTVNIAEAFVGDTLKYTINLTNTGNVAATGLSIAEVLPAELNFIKGSFQIGTMILDEITDLNNVILPNIDVKNTIHVSFKCKIEGMPQPNIIKNSVLVKYFYLVGSQRKDIEKTSETVETVIKPRENVIFTKTVDKKYADIGYELIYTLYIKNIYDNYLEANNIYDYFSQNIRLVPGSLTINGEISTDLLSHINIPNLSKNEEVTVVYRAIVTDGDIDIEEIRTNAILHFTYINSIGEKIIDNKLSTEAVTAINHGKISVLKEVVKSAVSLENTQSYKININNIGNRKVLNVKLIDILPGELQLIEKSVRVNDTIPLGRFNLDKVELGDIPPKANPIIVVFDAKVLRRPLNNIIKNKATVEFEYIVDEETKIPVKKEVSNEVSFGVKLQPVVSVKKTVDKIYANEGAEIQYTITITNESDENIDESYLIDEIPDNATFVTGSLKVGNIVNTTENLHQNPGITLGVLIKNQPKIVIYKVKVSEYPEFESYSTVNIISTQAKLNYFVTEEELGKRLYSASSNEVSTRIIIAKLKVEKTVDKIQASVGELLTYTIIIKEIGSDAVQQINLHEVVPENTELVVQSIEVNNKNTDQKDLSNIKVDMQLPDRSGKVKYSVRVIRKPQLGEIENTAQVTHLYEPDNMGYINAFKTKLVYSNKVVTQIIDAIAPRLIKTVDKKDATNDEELTYTLTIRNLGNQDINDVTIIDNIPRNTQYLENTLNNDGGIGGITRRAINIRFESIESGGSKIIFYKVITKPRNRDVNFVQSKAARMEYKLGSDIAPVQTVESNSISTNLKVSIIEIEKTVKKFIIAPEGESKTTTIVSLDDILIYTINIKNSGNVEVSNLKLSETLSPKITIVSDSLMINDGVIVQPYDFSSIRLGTIGIDRRVKIEFKANINANIPENKIVNISKVIYDVVISPTRIVTKTTEPVLITTTVTSVPQVILTKTVDRIEADRGDELLYTLTLKNKGPKVITNVIIIDTIPENTKREDSMIEINGVYSTSSDRFIIGGIPGLNIDDIFTIKYKANIENNVREKNEIVNQGHAYYSFVDKDINDDPITLRREAESDRVITSLKYAELTVKKTVSRARATVGNILKYVIVITNVGTIEASDVIMMDNLPSNLDFILDSFYDGNIKISGKPDLSNYKIGILGKNENKTFTYSVRITTFPKTGQIKNICKVNYSYNVINQEVVRSTPKDLVKSSVIDIKKIKAEVYSDLSNIDILEYDLLEFKKHVDKQIATIGEVLTYTIIIVNKGSSKIVNITLKDFIPNNTTLVEGSLMIGGEVYRGILDRAGIGLKDLERYNDGIKVEFKAVINNSISINSIIDNMANLQYASLKFDGTKTSRTAYSTEGRTQIISGVTQIIAKRIVDKELAEENEILTFEIVITNSMDYEAIDIMLKEVLPKELKFISNSLMVNDVPMLGFVDMPNFSLKNMKVGVSSTIIYKAQVISRPISKAISNYTEIQYSLKNIMTTDKFFQESNNVITQIINPMVDNYAKYALAYKLKADKVGIVPIKRVCVRGNSIYNYNKFIVLSKGVTFKAQWSITFKINKGNYKVKAMLILNKEIIQRSVAETKGKINNYKFITLTGTGTFVAKDNKNILNIRYHCYSNNVNIVVASLKISEALNL